MWNRDIFRKRAEENKPELFHELVHPTGGIPSGELHTGDSLVIDFGNHYVGRFSFQVKAAGSHPDAPVFLKLKFCESKRELSEDSAEYHGWISRGWIQEEWLHIDLLPDTVRLPRRYAFRYVKIEVLDVSSKFSLIIENAEIDSTTSADDSSILPFTGTSEEEAIDRISIRTLRNCMQDFFEDGPKRDRRLWIGDFRLQALTNAAVYRNAALVKRCLYLFAACTDENGRIPACLFTEPEIVGDDTYMFDYSLFFIAVLADYVAEYQDTETGKELFPVALRQWELSKSYFDEKNVMKDRDDLGWCFLDWNLKLNKQAGAQFVYIYCIKKLLSLSEMFAERNLTDSIRKDISAKSEAAVKTFYDKETGLFVSGADRQISYAAQSWAVIAGVCSREENRKLLLTLQSRTEAEKMVTPYMNHVYVEALIATGMRKEAYEHMIYYWGSMVKDGADTFYELFNPEDPDESPYGSPIVNSYCHAWSCTPAYFMRKGGLKADRI